MVAGSTNREPIKQTLEGLRILIEFPSIESNIIVKQTTRPTFSRSSKFPKQTSTPYSDSEYFPSLNFLKSCHLCNKQLTPDKDVYMYRDEGFCSPECRNRQILVDDMKEIEISRKEREANYSFTHCGVSGHRCCNTCALLQELRRRRRKPFSGRGIIRPIFS
ncbi:Zf-FLZ domain [Dillenia turbinata]|uniref:Zf-FLZ domain n=1 Tax=Dillenia turbinata TaxID=194707 RepID=A0AAN8YVT1_9MAGN